MALKVVDAKSIQVANLVVLVYGNPAYGKTSLAMTAERPLLLDFDGGVHRAWNRSGKSAVRVGSWADVEGMDADDLRDHGTVVVDTVGWALVRLGEAIMASNPKMRAPGGALSLKGFGALKSRFGDWLKRVRSFGLDVVLVAHAEEADHNGDTVYRIEAQGGSRQVICQSADLIGRLLVDAKGRRLFTCNPTDTALGKNVGGLEDRPVSGPERPERPVLAEVIREAKRAINAEALEQDEEVQRVRELRAHVEGLDPADAKPWNDLMAKMVASDAHRVDKATLHEVALEKGMTFDGEAKCFVAAGQEPPSF